MRAGLTHAPFDDVPPEVIGPVFGGLASVDEGDNRTVIGDVLARTSTPARRCPPGWASLVERWDTDVVLRDPCEFGSLAAGGRATVPHAEVAIGIGNLQPWATSVAHRSPGAERCDRRARAGHVHGRDGDGAGVHLRAGQPRRAWRRRRPVTLPHSGPGRLCPLSVCGGPGALGLPARGVG